MERQRTEWRCRYANFRRFARKSVTIATSLERSEKEHPIDHAKLPTYICAYPENLVKLGRVGPVHSEIIGLQGDRLNEAD